MYKQGGKAKVPAKTWHRYIYVIFTKSLCKGCFTVTFYLGWKMLFMHKIVYIFSSNYILLFHGFEIHHFVIPFLNFFFQILVQFTTWFEFAMSILTPFLFGKILISNRLYQLYWNIISVQIFSILSLLKIWFLSQLGENLFCQFRRWQGPAI